MPGQYNQRSGHDNHSYTFNPKFQIGTPFEDPNEKQTFQTMKARDPQGNVRWKGAFTGGFQAGYKNTCGSKDGWVPATFVSSRANRTQPNPDIDNTNKRIFDYMDEEDIGDLNITNNIQVRQQFNHTPIKDIESEDLYNQVLTKNINISQSIGSKIFKKMKQNQAQVLAPENLNQLHQLLQNYRQNQILEQRQEQANNLVERKLDSYPFYSVGCATHPPQDEFLTIYSQLFRRVIRKPAKNFDSLQEEAVQRQKEEKNNKIFFDFTKALDQEPEYLKQIRQIQDYQEQAGKRPRKRVKNVVSQNNLQSLFIRKRQRLEQKQLNSNSYEDYMKKIPKDYDPYLRVKEARKNQDSLNCDNAEKKPRHKIFTVKERSNIIGEGNFSQKLSQRFVKSGGSSINSGSLGSNFVRASQQSSKKANQQVIQNSAKFQIVFDDQKKNNRFWDYVLELEGKKICAQLQYMQFEQAEKERRQFQQKYSEIKKKREKNKIQNKQRQKGNSKLPAQIEKALTDKNIKKREVIRKTGTWQPQKTLCKRFGCSMPFIQENNRRQKYRNKKDDKRNDSLEQPYF